MTRLFESSLGRILVFWPGIFQRPYAKGVEDLAKTEKTTFLQSAMILIIANMVVKLIGALFKIPITNLIGEEGMAYFGAAYNMYSWLFVLSTAGLPVAVSKMVSECYAKGQYLRTRKIFEVSVATFSVVGVVGSLVLFLGAGFFARAVNNDMARLSIVAISPRFSLSPSCRFTGGISRACRTWFPPPYPR